MERVCIPTRMDHPDDQLRSMTVIPSLNCMHYEDEEDDEVDEENQLSFTNHTHLEENELSNNCMYMTSFYLKKSNVMIDIK